MLFSAVLEGPLTSPSHLQVGDLRRKVRRAVQGHTGVSFRLWPHAVPPAPRAQALLRLGQGRLTGTARQGVSVGCANRHRMHRTGRALPGSLAPAPAGRPPAASLLTRIRREARAQTSACPEVAWSQPLNETLSPSRHFVWASVSSSVR